MRHAHGAGVIAGYEESARTYGGIFSNDNFLRRRVDEAHAAANASIFFDEHRLGPFGMNGVLEHAVLRNLAKF